TFTGTNGTLIGAHTPNTNTPGGEWTVSEVAGTPLWGVSTDLPVPGDYDGDGKTDIAVYRASTGAWWILNSGTNYTTYSNYNWGNSTDLPTPGDYDGDGKTDV